MDVPAVKAEQTVTRRQRWHVAIALAGLNATVLAVAVRFAPDLISQSLDVIRTPNSDGMRPRLALYIGLRGTFLAAAFFVLGWRTSSIRRLVC
jgi:hypothetical protein